MSGLIRREDIPYVDLNSDMPHSNVRVWVAFKEQVDVLPSADAVEVVRCKDCRYSHMTYDGECKYCDKWKEDGEALYLDGDFYCAYGERKEKCKECWYWSEVHKHCENKGGCQFKPYGEYKDGKEE